SFADLLLPARLIEIHEDVGIGRVEVRRWIVEGEMAVLADAGKHDVNWRAREFTPDIADHVFDAACAIEKVIRADRRFVDQVFTQIPPEARRMALWNPDVLIEVKEFDSRPVNARQRGQCLKELEL